MVLLRFQKNFDKFHLDLPGTSLSRHIFSIGELPGKNVKISKI